MKKIFNIMLCSAFFLSTQGNFWARSYDTRTLGTHERNYKKNLNNTDQQNQELNTLTYDSSVARAKWTSVVGVGNQIVKTDSMKKRERDARIQREKQAEIDRINAIKKQREDAVHQNHIDGFMNISNAVDEHMQAAHNDDASYSTKFTGSAQLEGASNAMKDSLRTAFGKAVENITSYANASAVMKAAGGSDKNGAHSKTILSQKSSSGKTIDEHLSNLEDIEDSMKNYKLSEEELQSLKTQHEKEVAAIKEAATSYWKANGGEGGFWNVAKDDIYFDHATFAEELENHMNENPCSANDHFTLHEENMTQHILASRQNAKSTSNKTE